MSKLSFPKFNTIKEELKNMLCFSEAKEIITEEERFKLNQEIESLFSRLQVLKNKTLFAFED